jgi:transposase-like protein
METILTRLQQSFFAWRSSSSKKRYSNPSLREQAVQCLSHYTYREVSEAIGLSVNTLRSWKKSLCSDQGSIDSASGFVAIDLRAWDIDERRAESLFTLQISLSNGILIKVESTSITSSAAFVAALKKEERPCFI